MAGSAPADAARAFAASRPGVEAVVQRIGLRTAQVVLVAGNGEWTRVVVPSVDEGRALCSALGIEARDAWTDPVRRRMGTYRRPPQEWADAPYPERSRPA